MNLTGPIPVTYNLAPQEGTRAVRIDLKFPEDNGALVDLAQLLSQGEFRQVQTLFIDNSANAQALTISSNSLNQTIQVPAGAQGFVPILAPNPLRFTVSSTGSAATIFALNYSVSPALWGISSGASSGIIQGTRIGSHNFNAGGTSQIFTSGVSYITGISVQMFGYTNAQAMQLNLVDNFGTINGTSVFIPPVTAAFNGLYLSFNDLAIKPPTGDTYVNASLDDFGAMSGFLTVQVTAK